MESHKFRQLVAVLGFLCLFSITQSQAAVVITRVTNGGCLAVSPGAFTVMSNIILTESLVSDMGTGAGVTLMLTAPAGFEFSAGSGNVVYTAGRDITSASLVVTASVITVTLNIPTNINLDALRIRNVGVRGLVANGSGNILRTASGGSASISGDAPGGGVNHGSLTSTGTGATISSIAPGVWSDAAIWNSGVVPSCSDNVAINHAVTADVSSILNNLTINAGGNLISDVAITVGGNFQMNGTGIYTHNNTTAAATTIFGGTESFSSASKLIINRWSNFGTPLPNDITGDFGAIEINTTSSWNQSGMFAPARIKNTLTINAGLFILDNGTGMTTSLALQDVVIGGTGRLQVQTGTARNLTLTTGNFTDNSSSTGVSAIVYLAVGDLNWTVNGNLTLNHRFSILEGSSAANVGNVVVDVNGNFAIGGTFDGLKRATGSLTMDISGTTLITGTPSTVMFKDYYTGDVNFTSGSMTVNAIANIYMLGSHSTVGAANMTINGDLIVTGNTTRLFLASNTANTNNVVLTVTNDLFVTGSQMYTALTGGNVDVQIGRNFTQTGVTSEFYAQRNPLLASPTTLIVSGAASISDGLFVVSRNLGSVTIDIDEVLTVQDASFYGMNNITVGNNGIVSLACSDLNISGGNFYLHRGYITDGRTVTVDIDNDLNINFTSSSQEVMFVARNSDNTTILDLNIGGNFIVAGSANGLFCSSVSAGNETIDIGGDMLINAGRVRFNAYENYTARGHNVTGNIAGSFIMSGGSIALSGNRGLINWTINGDYDQTAGYAVYKWLSPGLTTVSVLGDYNVSNSNVTFYSKTTTATSDGVTLTINGDATLDNAVIMFDSCLTSTATHRMVFRGSSVTYSDNVTFTHAAHLTNRLYFGNIVYDRAGTITLRRTSPTFDIRQTKQNITAGTSVDFTSSPYDLMISSHLSSVASTHTTLTVDGNLDMGSNMITGRSEANYYACATFNSGAKLTTAHTGGLYSGTAANSCIYPLIFGSLRMDYFLHANSTVEYNGINNQRLTGVGVGLATSDNHKFGIIIINFLGTPDVEFVYLTSADSVIVRTGLSLLNGELNLDSDHNSTGGGNQLHILNNSFVTRLNGYIRSETYDGSALVKWKIQSAGTYVVPFGYNSTSYIPLTFQLTSGNAGNPTFSTNRVANDNTPYPPTITHVNNVVGADNSSNTVDRFWSLDVPGNVTSTITFSYTASELGAITSPRAQRWEPVSRGWFPPNPVQSNPTAITTTVTGVTGFNTWWTLAPSGTPLPIELLSFEAKPEGKVVNLDWVTASELNNDYFTIERSFDGSDYKSLLRVEGAGTTTSVNNYTATDEAPKYGANYYRLKQTDFDGYASYSDIKLVNFKGITPIQVYPNPIIGQTLTISAGNSEEIIQSISIFDLAGKLIIKKENLQESQTEKTTDFELGNDLTKGTYIVEVNSASGAFRERIVVQ